MAAMLTQQAIKAIGFKTVGDNVLLSDKASFHNPSMISIGNHVRIDDFCILSASTGGIYLENYIHLAANCTLIGKGKITLSDFCNLSSRVAIYASSDDYSGAAMTNPMVPCDYTNVTHADVFLAKHVIVGCGSVILPGLTLGQGVAIGALSLVNRSCDAFGIYAGSPIKWIKARKQDLLTLEQAFLKKSEFS